MRYLCAILALLVALQPVVVSARGGRGGGGRGGGGARTGGGARAGGARAGGGGSYGGRGSSSFGGRGSSSFGGARPSTGAGGFNFGGDTMRAVPRPGAVGSSNVGSRGSNVGSRGTGNLNGGVRPDHGTAGRPDRGTSNRPNGGNRGNRNTNIGSGNRVTINNPVYGGGGAYGWNGGVAWAPAPYYWGGGFWGAMAIGVTSAAVFGAIVNDEEHVTYNSYQIQPNTPGSSFLTSYGLTQVKCGPEGLVVVYGPENSVICANPNDKVRAGEYDLNTENLSLSARQ